MAFSDCRLTPGQRDLADVVPGTQVTISRRNDAAMKAGLH